MGYRQQLLEIANRYLGQNVSVTCNSWWMNFYNNNAARFAGRTRVWSTSDNWCASFVCWIAAQVVPFQSLNITQTALETVIPFDAGALEMKNLYEQTGAGSFNGNHTRYKAANGLYIPQPGDLFFSQSNAGYHVGFVHSVDPANLSFRTLEGNCGGIVNTTSRRYDGMGEVYGFGCNEIRSAVHEGFLDSVSATKISGWAYNGLDSDRLRIHIYVYKGGTRVAIQQVTANKFRQDLYNAHKGDGNCAFEWNCNLYQYGAGGYEIHAYIITANQDIYPDNKECAGSPKYVSV